MMKRFLEVLLVLSFSSVLVLPARAQPFITPWGMHFIPVFNYIENIEDFPDSRFISAYRTSHDARARDFVTGDGMIPSAYPKLCINIVYAVPKAAIGVSDELVCAMNSEEFSAFLESSDAKEVVSGIEPSELAPDLSTEISVTNYYHIALGQTLEYPTRTVVTHGLRDVHIVLIVLPIVGLAGIVAILAKRRRK